MELNALVERPVSVADLNGAYETAASGELRALLEYSEDPLVSTDIVGNPASAVFDSQLTAVNGQLVKVVAWYDNEWGFSNRVVDTLALLGRS